MPTQTVFEKVSQGPGPIGPSPGFLLHAGESAFARITANLGTGVNQFDHFDGDGNFTLLCDLLAQRSDDGGQTWVFESLAPIVGGSRTKDGKFPGQTVNNTHGADRLYRVTLTPNKELPIGCNWETP